MLPFRILMKSYILIMRIRLIFMSHQISINFNYKQKIKIVFLIL